MRYSVQTTPLCRLHPDPSPPPRRYGSIRAMRRTSPSGLLVCFCAPQGAVALSEVMSLEELLCPLGGNRERMLANIKGLRGACRYGGAAPAGESCCTCVVEQTMF